jgi:hypothetical protein
MNVREAIDARCDEFESAWQSGRSPRMEEYLVDLDGRGREHLLRDLLAIELHYRRARGQAVTREAILAEHPTLGRELAQAFKRLEIAEALKNQEEAPTQGHVSRAGDVALTVDAAAKPSASRGLHIRCPHCTSPVELVADTPFESVTCIACGSAFQLVDREESATVRPLLTLGRFELISRLGMGGFGSVWKARDSELDRIVAVKIPRKGQLEPHELELFFREARSAAQLRHPNIVPVHEVGREGDTIFIVSDFVHGQALSDWTSGASPNFRTIAQVTSKIAEALHHAHEEGIVHRDLKPANILMDARGEPHLMDFGLAKREVGEITMTIDGQILGTPSYMSPEQARGDSHWIDRRADIYSLGVVLFQLLTGELPFRGNAQMQIQQRLTEDAPDPRKLNAFIPRDLATICEKCLQREPNSRYATAREVSRELGRYVAGEPIHARPISRIQRAARWARRKPALALAGSLVLFLAVAGPITAIVIATQGNRIETLGVENSGLIVGNKVNRTEIGQLEEALSMWEGGGNPFGGMPKDLASARKSLLEGPITAHAVKLEEQASGGTYRGEQLLAANLALATIYDELGRDLEARQRFQAAIDQLEQLTLERPNETRLWQVMADAYTRLARLTIEADHAAAVSLLEKARVIHERLAQANRHARFHVEWLDAELRSGAARGFGNRSEWIKRLVEAKQSLEQNSYSAANPAELYELACLFGGREPLLLPDK